MRDILRSWDFVTQGHCCFLTWGRTGFLGASALPAGKPVELHLVSPVHRHHGALSVHRLSRPLPFSLVLELHVAVEAAKPRHSFVLIQTVQTAVFSGIQEPAAVADAGSMRINQPSLLQRVPDKWASLGPKALPEFWFGCA